MRLVSGGPLVARQCADGSLRAERATSTAMVSDHFMREASCLRLLARVGYRSAYHDDQRQLTVVAWWWLAPLVCLLHMLGFHEPY